MGSLVAALASWLCARQAGGRWLLRIDDLDRQRCSTAHRDTILRQIEAHGLVWDGAPILQSQRTALYEDAIDTLWRRRLVYSCDCTRARLKQTARAGADDPVYDGHCRRHHPPARARTALRLQVPIGLATVEDVGSGRLTGDLQSDVGDFVIRRRDGVFGYHLSCALDEADLGITEVVRGADLTTSAIPQCVILDLLHLRKPTYRHVPLITTADGRKLSKQNHAPALTCDDAGNHLLVALDRLGQRPPEELAGASIADVLEWALTNWNPLAMAAHRP